MGNDQNLSIRLERARSWIKLGEAPDTPEHARFIFYWIAFNAMYGLTPIDPDHLDKEPETQRSEIRQFLKRVKEMSRYDCEAGTYILDKAIQQCPLHAKALIEDPFLSRRYWVGVKSPPSIEKECKRDWVQVNEELDKKRVDDFFDVTFHRLTVLRNQIIHGSATASPQSKGYPSLQNGLLFLQVIVPAFFTLLETYGHQIAKWPKAPYPRKGHREHPHL